MDTLGNSAAQRDIEYVLHGYTNLSRHRQHGPLVIGGGKGVYIHDENGRPYIEAAAGMWCTAFGFGEEALIEAAVAQMRKLPYYHTVADKSLYPTIDLAEKLASLVPIERPKIYFALSGSEANDFLIKFLWYYNNAIDRPRKKKIISRINGYHGATVGAASLTGVPLNHKGFDLPIPNVLHADDPHYYRNGLPGESQDEFADRMARNLEDLILREGPETVAAFIAEPCTGAGGVVVPSRRYYEKVQELLHRHDVLFLDDEVITGFCRTGNMFGAETFGIRPDTMTLAKGLSSAYQPIAALVLSRQLYEGLEKGSDRFGFFAHGTTYSGHPVGAAVALKVLQLIEERDILGHVRRVAPLFARRLRAFAEHPLVGEVRVCGLMGAVELVADKATRRMFQPVGSVAKLVRDRTEELGVVARAVPCGDSIAFSPPLIINEDEINEVFDRFGQALDEIGGKVEREGLREAGAA